MKKIFTLSVFISGFSFFTFSQTWIRCSAGLPDTAVLSLTRIGNTMFCGMEKAGVYKSIDGGNTWITTPKHASLKNSQTWSMTSLDTFVFAGQRGSGVLMSSPNGTAWTPMNNGIVSGTKMIQDMLTVGGRLFAASWGGGIYTSTDTAKTWSKLYNNQGLDDLHALTLANNSTYLFCGTAGVNTAMPDTGVVFVTPLTGGTSWTVINNGQTRNGAHLEAVTGLEANDYMQFTGNDDVGIHRSADNGQLWIQSPNTNLNGDVFSIEIVGKYVYYGTTYGGIFWSSDSGKTFTANNVGLNYNATSLPYWVNDLMVYGQYIYAATDIGVFKQQLPLGTGIAEEPATSALTAGWYLTEGQINFVMDRNVQDAALVIYDPLGNRIRSLEFSGDRVSVNNKGIAKGIYFYQIITQGKIVATGKLFR